MQQTIKPLGIATNPSDYDCADGELAASFNIINEDGALRPLPQPVATNITLKDGDVIRCIHATSTFKHYIATNGSTLAWYDSNGNRQSIPLPATIHKVTPIGNTLAVLTDSGLYYLLWKYDNTNNATYTNLGSKPPFLELQFGVSVQKSLDTSTHVSGRYIWYTFDCQDEDIPGNTASGIRIINNTLDVWSESVRSKLTQAVWAAINLGNAEVTKKNLFYAPFFVRYCFKLYDGSSLMHSAPVFMPIGTPFSYRVLMKSYGTDTDNNIHEDGIVGYNQFVYYYPNRVALTYRCAGDLQTLLENWGDIVKSVDIFVSLPIIREKDFDVIKAGHIDDGTQLSYIAGSLQPRPFPTSPHTENNNETITYTNNVVPDLYLTPTQEYLDMIRGEGTFYKISSIKISDLNQSTLADVPIRSGVLSTLATQEAMTDDYHSHNDVLPTIDEDGHCITSMFVYNNRLSVSAPTERLFQGFSINTLMPVVGNTSVFSNIHAVVVYIKTDQGVKRVVHNYQNPILTISASALLLTSNPIFYPDNRAFMMEVYMGSPLKVLRLSMKQHSALNGAITQGTLITSLTPTYTLEDADSIPTPIDTLTTLNQIRTSEVDNPFYYPAINYKRVGVGTILALSTSAKALSQGQFGQHPLYAFCTDGVWALGVDTTDGTFVPAQPFTRDVCSNPDSILQLDSTVLFPTDRGIMLVSGSQTQCITEKLDYPHFQLGILPQNVLFMPSDPRGIPTTIRQYIKDCKMIYDYRNQHVIVFNPAIAYAYVYSLKSGLWAMMQANFVATINAYPHAMAVNSNSQLVEFPDPSDKSEPSDPSSPTNSQFYVTRPFKLGSNDHKTITALVQHGMIENRQHVRLILYGSRDLATWHVVGSSTTNALRGLSGTPYTAFRLAVIADLTATESLSDFVVEFTPKHTRVLR